MEPAPNKACLLLHKKSCMRPDVKQAIKAVRQRDVDLMVRIPWGKKDIKTFVKEAKKAGITRVIAGGGDGTLNDVVNCLIKKRHAENMSLGVLPLGTANDFARGAGIPRDDLTAALHLAATGQATPIDVGQVNKKFFVNVASGGFGADVTATTPQKMKAALGGVAYTLMGMVKVMNLQPYTGRVITPNGKVEEGDMVVMAVGNNRFAGGGFEVTPKANLQDGLLDLAVITSVNPGDVKAIAAELEDPFNEDNRFLLYRQLESFIMESDRPLQVNLDGEPYVDSRFEFTIRPKVLRVVLGDVLLD